MSTNLRRLARAATAAAVALPLLAPTARATVDLTALRVRIGDHPAYVRVVVDLVDGTLRPRDVLAVDPDPADGVARLRITATRVRTEAAPVAASGVGARMIQGDGRITLRTTATAGRFKGVAYSVIHGFPERLVVDLWKSAPPTAAATVLVAPDRCLRLDSIVVRDGRVVVRGRERGLFEHQFAVQLRNRRGRVIAAQSVIAGAGRWHATLGYDVRATQAGTLEAVDLSEKDAAIACIVQARVRLPA